MLSEAAALLVMAFARLVTAVRPEWRGCTPEARPRIYFANHASHGDFVLIWTVLPRAVRRITRPVAGADYWTRSALRRYFADHVFKAVLIDRDAAARTQNPVAQMTDAVDAGNGLILFPEGTRNTTGEKLLPFKSGLFHLARSRPQIELVPVWIDNINRVLPKGEFVPVPILCTVTFGAPLKLEKKEDKADFLDRARGALLRLSEKVAA
jgi:1-acyl-sn-glycerol-3-phosphate acyltransferase